MTQLQSYTTIEQSKKLAEILPIESADMEYLLEHWIDEKTGRHKEGYCEIPVVKVDDDYPLQPITLPCWSLAALLDILPDEITDDGDVYRNMFFHLKGKYIIQYPRLTTLWPSLLSVEAYNPVDACYEMIIKLNAQNLI